MRRRWSRQTPRVNHVDDWLMTYADMITLLLCFFAIFLSVSISKKVIPPKAEISQPAPPPAHALLEEHKAPKIELSRLIEATAIFPVQKKETPPEKLPEVAVIPEIQAQTAPPPTDPPPTTQPVAQPVADLPASLPEIVDHLKTQGGADIDQKGDRITTLQISSAAFFDSGSAVLSGAGQSILQSVAVNLKSEKFRDYQITVEGHTDDTPISTAQFPSNWELSTARASAVVHFFLVQGIPAQKLRAAGYADTFPLAPNRNSGGNAIPENQAQNRRVVIKLEKIEKTE